jgi:hypothetical protein
MRSSNKTEAFEGRAGRGAVRPETVALRPSMGERHMAGPRARRPRATEHSGGSAGRPSERASERQLKRKA